MFTNLLQIILVAGVTAATVVQMAGLGSPTAAVPIADAMTTPDPALVKQQAYIAERTQILQELAVLNREKRWADVQVAALPWLDQADVELLTTYDQAREQDLVQKLKDVPASDVDKNLDFYTTLVALKPDNTRYQNKQGHYLGLLGDGADSAARASQILCQGQARAAAKVPTISQVTSQPGAVAQSESGDKVLTLGLLVETPDGAEEALQASCLLGADKSVMLSAWAAR